MTRTGFNIKQWGATGGANLGKAMSLNFQLCENYDPTAPATPPDVKYQSGQHLIYPYHRRNVHSGTGCPLCDEFQLTDIKIMDKKKGSKTNMMIFNMKIPYNFNWNAATNKVSKGKESFYIEFPPPWPNQLNDGTNNPRLECGWSVNYKFEECVTVDGALTNEKLIDGSTTNTDGANMEKFTYPYTGARIYFSPFRGKGPYSAQDHNGGTKVYNEYQTIGEATTGLIEVQLLVRGITNPPTTGD